jgi:hypothetical protein
MRSNIGAAAGRSPNFAAFSMPEANYVSIVDIFQLPCYRSCRAAYLGRARPKSKQAKES